MTASDNAAHLALFPSFLFELLFKRPAGTAVAAVCHVIRRSPAMDRDLYRTFFNLFSDPLICLKAGRLLCTCLSGVWERT